MIKLLLIVLLLGPPLFCGAQDEAGRTKQVWGGLGFGLDHGGMGVRLDGRVIPALSVIMGAGYNFAGVGWNVGLIYRIIPHSNVCPYITGLYGYNTAIRYGGRGGYVGGENYNGPTFGVGLELSPAGSTNFFHLGILVPIRSQAAYDALIYARGSVLPIHPSLGFHF